MYCSVYDIRMVPVTLLLLLLAKNIFNIDYSKSKMALQSH